MTDLQEEELPRSASDSNLPNGDSHAGTENTTEQDDIVTKNKAALNRSASCASILQGNGMNKMKNLSRRVSFPSDDKLISGYNEPRNPWEHAHGTTTEDLIQAYTQACQSWNVKPITKLLLQLQEIKDFTVRANSLTLKGEKLETRVVETLESIFKRVQFITVDLEATNLDEEAAASLFDMIEYYESAVNVLVGFNKNLGNRGWQAAAHMMRKMSCLRLFDGHSVPLSMQAAPFVGRALRLSNTLVTLHLENAYLTSRPLLLVVAALKMNTTLRELFLADNQLGSMDALQIANLLKFNRILQLLDLRNNPIQDIGIGHIAAGLNAQSAPGLNGPVGGLQTLVLWNNQITQNGMFKLALALSHTVSLATLNLGQNAIGDDGMLRLKEGLLQNHSLLRLGLVGTKLTDEGAVAVAEYLAESSRIIRLDIRNNDIKVAGLMALSLAFKINSSLLRLDIDKPNKKDSLKELAVKQESLMTDIVAYAARNKEAALAKVQAAAARQEGEAKATEKEQGGLRYMDMTNRATPSTVNQSGVTCSNNSNNQHCPIRHVGGASRIATVTRDVDDTPEDSPEFLPRSSVPYHQVAPVMLSNSELAKRAAAAKTDQEDNTGTGRFRIKPVSKSQKDKTTSLSQPENKIHETAKICDAGDQSAISVAVTTQNFAENPVKDASAGDGTKVEGQQNLFGPGERTLASSLQIKNAASFYGSKVKDQESEKRRENLEIFSKQIKNTVLEKDGSSTSELDREIDPSNCQDTVQLTVEKTDDDYQKQLPQHCDSASNEIQNLVALATESVSPTEGAVAPPSAASSNEIQGSVAVETDAPSSDENASSNSDKFEESASTNNDSAVFKPIDEEDNVHLATQPSQIQDMPDRVSVESENPTMQYKIDGNDNTVNSVADNTGNTSLNRNQQTIPTAIPSSSEGESFTDTSVNNQDHMFKTMTVPKSVESGLQQGMPTGTKQLECVSQSASSEVPLLDATSTIINSAAVQDSDQSKLDDSQHQETTTAVSSRSGQADTLDSAAQNKGHSIVLTEPDHVVSEDCEHSENPVLYEEPYSVVLTSDLNSDSLVANSVSQNTEDLQKQSFEVDETSTMESSDAEKELAMETKSTEKNDRSKNDSPEHFSILNDKVNTFGNYESAKLNMTKHIQVKNTEVDAESQEVDVGDCTQNNTVICSLVTPSEELSSDIGNLLSEADRFDDGTVGDILSKNAEISADICNSVQVVSSPQEGSQVIVGNENEYNDIQISVSESGIDTITDDNSILSNDFSPMEEQQTILQTSQETADASTPDSGVVQINATGEGMVDHTYHSNTVSSNHDFKAKNLKDKNFSDHSCIDKEELEINDDSCIENIDVAKTSLDKFPSGD